MENDFYASKIAVWFSMDSLLFLYMFFYWIGKEWLAIWMKKSKEFFIEFSFINVELLDFEMVQVFLDFFIEGEWKLSDILTRRWNKFLISSTSFIELRNVEQFIMDNWLNWHDAELLNVKFIAVINWNLLFLQVGFLIIFGFIFCHVACIY